MSEHQVSTVSQAQTHSCIEDLVKHARLEAMPFGAAEEQVSALPADVTVTVTCSPKHGLDHTLDVAARWAQGGRAVVPHIAARMVESSGHLDEVLGRLRNAGISEIFLIGGDADRPLGPYGGAGELIAAMSERTEAPRTIGIAGYPEGHPRIDNETLEEALLAKQPFASYVATQICFDPEAFARWARRLRERGLSIPIIVGIPGRVQRRKLAQMSLQVGVGGSLRFLTKHGNVIKGLARSRSYEPGDFLRGLAPYVSEPGYGVAGLHVFTFNEIAETRSWQTAFADRLLAV